MDASRSWQFLEDFLGGAREEDISAIVWKPISPNSDLREAVLFLAQPGMVAFLEAWLAETVFQSLSEVVSLKFWDFFKMAASEDFPSSTDAGAAVLFDAMDYLFGVYTGQYLEAVSRLVWLTKLAASTPSVNPSAESNASISAKASHSAFTPIKAGGQTMEKSVWFKKQEPLGKPAQSSQCKDSERSSPDKSAAQCEASLWENECLEEMEDSETDRNTNKQPESMDGSYVAGNSAVQPGICPSNPAEKGILFPAKMLLNAADDDDESFIRSPIGGNKKLMSATPNEGLAVGSLFAQAGQGLRAMSNTSTPGMVLNQTPGPLTPIVAHDSPASSVHNYVGSETPSFRDDLEKKRENQCGDTSNLPDASLVFGYPMSSRPLPGQAVSWPGAPTALVTKVQVMIKSILFYTLPLKFSTVIRAVYSKAFDVYRDKLNLSENSSAQTEMNLEQFDKMNDQMDKMGLMELLSGSAVTEIVHGQIEKHIEEECRGNFDTSFLQHLETLLDEKILNWLRNIYAGKNSASQVASVSAFRDRLRHFIYEKYGKSLIAQFFDIIIDFPDSKPAIEDLSSCLEKTDLRSELVSSLKISLEGRLLHPGVNTAVILTAYINAIKALRLLEPAGVILELVCEPVGRYLRSREDTVRCIVASLTDDSNNELVNELVNTKPVSEETDDENGAMSPCWHSWMPDPVDADPSSGSKFRRSADILSTLVNIYGSKELFVNEYRALLADRILMQYNYDVERELRYLELLKLRFGEAQLHFCEVMLRDVAESRRVNSRIHEACKKNRQEPEEQEPETKKDVELNAMILSAQYWPAFRDEKIRLPAELQDHLDKYTRSFEQQKQNRTLVWKPHLGVMNIDLELNGETLSFSVSPVQAAIIFKFQEKNQWSLESLSQELEMTPSVLRRKLAFWQSQGLLHETSDHKQQLFTLVEEPRRGRSGAQDILIMADIEEEVESAMASAQQQKEEEMEILWTYIQGMLANLDCLPIERIHAMLRMFASEEPGSELSQQQLKTFLDGKVRDQILIFSSGVYRLNK